VKGTGFSCEGYGLQPVLNQQIELRALAPEVSGNFYDLNESNEY